MKVIEISPCVAVHEVTEGGEEIGFEYRCTFCSRAGGGYLDEESAVNGARRHRCQEPRRWNEMSRSAPKLEEQ